MTVASDPLVLQRLAAIEARLAALEAGGGAGTTSGGVTTGPASEALPDHMLDNAWADKAISRDPKQWKGITQVGRTYSRANPDWLEMMAKNLDYKAACGRAEVPVRMNNKGKPWHESDTFEARICRGWAIRNRAKKAAAPEPEEQIEDDGPPF